MKFTEGYWERNERANAKYAAQAFILEKIPQGLKLITPVRVITDRGGALDVTTITTEFTSIRKDIISVKSYHYEGYERNDMHFCLNEDAQEVEVEITEKEGVLRTGRMTVRIDRQDFGISYEMDGGKLTGIGFRNLGYMQYNREISSKFPGKDYLKEEYEPYMVTELSLDPGECVYGLGERFTAFVKNGQAVDCWNEDGGTSSQMSYKNIPFYVTNKHYGVYIDHSDNVSLEIASEKVENVGISVPGEELRYHIIGGDSMKDVIRNYTDLTGKPALVPAWSFGLWLSTSFTTNYDEETTTSFIKGMKENDIPLSVFHFDCYWMKEFHWCDFEWDERTFPDVEGMLRRYKEKGLKLSVWINPYIAQGTRAFMEAAESGYLLKRQDGKGIRQTDTWQPGMGIVDFTNPEAVKWYQSKLQSLFDVGIDCLKTDFAERIPTDVVYSNGANPQAMHNYYTLLYNQTVFDYLKKVKGEGEAVLFARSATVGGQQFPIHWGGDNSASYASMAESLRGGLSLMMSGFGYWSHDIGGFELTSTADLFKRWLQFGLLSTHSRLHGSKSYRVPWLFDDEAVEICRKFTKLKARLMPYFYAKAVQSHTEGLPVMRSMVLEFEKDLAVKYLDMQYMLGESILVAPIFNEKGIAEYYLPKGMWTHLLSGEVKEGEKWYCEEYDYHSLPLFVKENTLLPMGTIEDSAEYDYAKNLQIQIFELKEDKKAICKIVNTKGEEEFAVEATRKGKEICIKISRHEDALSYKLRNIGEIAEVQGGIILDKEAEVVIRPTKKEVTIWLK